MTGKWRSVGGGTGNFIKWDEEGKTVEGIWEGQHDGQWGAVGTLLQPDGTRIRFPMSTVLLDRFTRIKEGAEVKIEYVGKQTSKKGTEFKAFEVWVAGDDALMEDEP